MEPSLQPFELKKNHVTGFIGNYRYSQEFGVDVVEMVPGIWEAQWVAMMAIILVSHHCNEWCWRTYEEEIYFSVQSVSPLSVSFMVSGLW